MYCARLAIELLRTIQNPNIPTTKRIPLYVHPGVIEDVRRWENQDFEKEMRKRKDRELRRILGYDQE